MNKFLQDMLGIRLRILLLMLTDLLWSGLLIFASFVLYRHFSHSDYAIVIFRDFWVIPLMLVCIASISRCYHGSLVKPGAPINRIEEIRRLCLATLGAYLLGILFLYVSGKANDYPLWPLLPSCLATIIGFQTIRFFVRYTMKKLHIGQIRVIIIGAGETARDIGITLEKSCYFGYEIIGYLDDDPAKEKLDIFGKKWLGPVSSAVKITRSHQISYVICCIPPLLLKRVMKNYTKAFDHVLVVPTRDIVPISSIYPTSLGFLGALEFQNVINIRSLRFLKFITDIFFAVIALLLLFPLFLILVILVKFSSPGPVFYVAKRLGQHGKTIDVLKFRSMYQDAETKLERLLEEDPKLKDEWRKSMKLKNDPRVTPIGRFLRKTSLDELPQFINVLRGEMALIGPRPIVEEEIHYYAENYDYFKRVKPGITGLWQVSGRNDLSYPQRIALDMFYVMNWSFWLDWYIFCKTFLVVFSGKGSY